MTDAIVLVFLTNFFFRFNSRKMEALVALGQRSASHYIFCEAKFKIKNEHISINLHIHVVNKSQLNNAELLDKPKQKANKAMYFNFYQRPVKYFHNIRKCIT